MEKKTTDTATEREAVKEYLQQYHMARQKKRILEERRRVLSSELARPAGSSFVEPSRRSNRVNADGFVSVVVQIEKVEERIEEQREEMAKAVLHVMDLIDLLPQGSMERTVVEMRHIDCKGWDQIAREVYMSRSAVFNRYNAALETLMGYKRTRKLLTDFKKAERKKQA